jgi:hypothetical protein
MFKKIRAWFKKDEPINTFVLPEPLYKTKYRKPSDTTKLTKQMYDFVIEMKAGQEDYNDFFDGSNGEEKKYETTEDLCDYLNIVFGTNFSRSKLSRIWQGKVNREDLPEGIKYEVTF